MKENQALDTKTALRSSALVQMFRIKSRRICFIYEEDLLLPLPFCEGPLGLYGNSKSNESCFKIQKFRETQFTKALFYFYKSQRESPLGLGPCLWEYTEFALIHVLKPVSESVENSMNEFLGEIL